MIIIVVVGVKNVLVYDIDTNCRTRDVASCYTSFATVKTQGIDAITVEFVGINFGVTVLRDVQAISFLFGYFHQIVSIRFEIFYKCKNHDLNF